MYVVYFPRHIYFPGPIFKVGEGMAPHSSTLAWKIHGLQPTRLLRPWDFPGKSIGVGCHCFLWGTNLDMADTEDLPHIHESNSRGVSSITLKEPQVIYCNSRGTLRSLLQPHRIPRLAQGAQGQMTEVLSGQN